MIDVLQLINESRQIVLADLKNDPFDLDARDLLAYLNETIDELFSDDA